MKLRIRLFALPLIFLAVAAPDTSADWRSYVWTYEYQTVERGMAEFESYFTISAPDIDSLEDNTAVEQLLELEVGMSERFDFGFYQQFEQEPGRSLSYQGYKLRFRYRFGEKGTYILDPLAYFEYKGKPDFSEHGIEFKLILARDFGPNNISVNPILEFEGNGDWESEPAYAAGLRRNMGDLLKIGIEIKGSESGHYIGPVVSHGSPHVWGTLGSAFGIGDIDEGKPEFQLRLLLGVEL
jgi:hypothetical protein